MIELRYCAATLAGSETDDLETLRSKLQAYLDSGVQLGWLINPQDKQAEVYRQNQPVEVLDLPVRLSGEDVLPGFVLAIDRLF